MMYNFSLVLRYPCDQCKYKATDKSHLRRHKQRVHQGLKHPCELCGQLYSDMSTLKRHIKDCTNHKKCNCNISIIQKSLRNQNRMPLNPKDFAPERGGGQTQLIP